MRIVVGQHQKRHDDGQHGDKPKPRRANKENLANASSCLEFERENYDTHRQEANLFCLIHRKRRQVETFQETCKERRRPPLRQQSQSEKHISLPSRELNSSKWTFFFWVVGMNSTPRAGFLLFFFFSPLRVQTNWQTSAPPRTSTVHVGSAAWTGLGRLNCRRRAFN